MFMCKFIKKFYFLHYGDFGSGDLAILPRRQSDYKEHLALLIGAILHVNYVKLAIKQCLWIN